MGQLLSQQFFLPLLLWLSRDKDPGSEEVARLNVLVFAVVTTGLLMLSYSLNAYFTVGNHFGLKYACILYSLIHFTSPLLYRVFPSIAVCTHVFVGFGFLFQFHHATATGGFYSVTSVWFAILPFIAGVVAGWRHMAVWGVVSVSAIFSLLALTSAGLTTNDITPVGRLWSQINVTIGYILLNCGFFLVYLDFRDQVNRKLEKRNGRIKNLLRILVHDVSNPLTAINFSIELLKRLHHDQKTDDLLSRMDRAAKGIEDIVIHARNFEAIDSNKVQLKLVAVDVRQGIRDAVEILRPRIEAKELEVSLDFPLSKTSVLVDRPTFVSQVLSNILSNAVKFSFRGNPIEVSVEQPKTSAVRICIRDHGVGMTPEQLSNIFEPNKETSTLGTDGERGSGFGMPIVKSTIQQYGGHLEIQSWTDDECHGTEVAITLKAAA